MDERCTDALIWELMLQAGPVGMFLYIMMPHLSLIYDSIVNVHLPKDRISMAHQGYGFCEFLTEEDAEYACKIMNQIKLWGKPIRVNKVCPRFFLHITHCTLLLARSGSAHLSPLLRVSLSVSLRTVTDSPIFHRHHRTRNN